MVLNEFKISSFVIAILVKPLTLALYFAATKSNQPQRLGLPVVAPNSFPTRPRV